MNSTMEEAKQIVAVDMEKIKSPTCNPRNNDQACAMIYLSRDIFNTNMLSLNHH